MNHQRPPCVPGVLFNDLLVVLTMTTVEVHGPPFGSRSHVEFTVILSEELRPGGNTVPTRGTSCWTNHSGTMTEVGIQTYSDVVMEYR